MSRSGLMHHINQERRQARGQNKPAKGCRRKSAKLRRLAFGLLACAGSVLIASRHFAVNLSASMPRGLYRIEGGSPKPGELAVFPVKALPVQWRGQTRAKRLLKGVIWQNESLSYVRGEHPLSFDSRYYGSVETRFLKKARLLVRFESAKEAGNAY